MLKLQHFGHLMQIGDSLEKSLMLGKIEGRRRRGRQSVRWLDGITMNDHELGQTPEDGGGWGGWHTAIRGDAKSPKRLGP